MAKTKLERITTIEERILQLQNQKKQLVQKQKEDERKARTNRLCRRHGLLEKFMPDIISITDEQFEELIKRTIASNRGRETLAEITRSANASTAKKATETTAQPNPTPPAKPNHATNSTNPSGGANPHEAEQSGA